MKHCLLLVDLQNDYFAGGTMVLEGIENAAANARTILDEFRRRTWPVIHVQHLASRPGASFFLPGTNGADIHATVSPRPEEPVVIKHYPNSFRETTLLDLLRAENPARLVICGAMSHMCIEATTRAAFDLGFTCVVADDACATRKLVHRGRTVQAADVHATSMAALAAVYAAVQPTRDVLQELG